MGWRTVSPALLALLAALPATPVVGTRIIGLRRIVVRIGLRQLRGDRVQIPREPCIELSGFFG